MDPIDDVVERRHHHVPETPSGRLEEKLDRFAVRFNRWLTRIGDELFGPRVAEKIFGPHARRT